MYRIQLLAVCGLLVFGCTSEDMSTHSNDALGAGTASATTGEAPGTSGTVSTDATDSATATSTDGVDGTDGASSNGIDSTDGGATSTDDGATSTDGTDGNQTRQNTCTDAKASGAVSSKEADLIYPGVPAEVTLEYAAGQGCITGLQATTTLDGGCKLTMDLDASAGSWTISQATFNGDSKCGEFWPAWAQGNFVFAAGQSFSGVVSPPTLAADATCYDGELSLQGRLRFINVDGKTLDLSLDGLKFKGGITAVAGTTSSCPVPYVSPCPPQGPYGTEVGDVMTDLKLFDCNGDPVHLHELCGEKVALVNLFASW